MEYPGILEIHDGDVKTQIETLVDYLMELRQASLQSILDQRDDMARTQSMIQDLTSKQEDIIQKIEILEMDIANVDSSQVGYLMCIGSLAIMLVVLGGLAIYVSYHMKV